MAKDEVTVLTCCFIAIKIRITVTMLWNMQTQHTLAFIDIIMNLIVLIKQLCTKDVAKKQQPCEKALQISFLAKELQDTECS